jgi:TPR repeat protein
MKSLYCILVTAILVIGCKPKETHVIADKVVESDQVLISGQMFIVTESRANVVFGDVKIGLVDRDTIIKYFRSHAIAWSNELIEAQSKVDLAITKYDGLNWQNITRLASAKKYFWERYERLKTEKLDAEKNQAFDHYLAASVKLADLFKAKQASEVASGLKEALLKQSLHYDRINWPSAEEPPAIWQAVTDSEGRFKFLVPASSTNLMLLAKADRQIGDKKEHYWWLTEVSLRGKTTEVILSNDNLDHCGVWYFLPKPIQEYMISYESKLHSYESDVVSWSFLLDSHDSQIEQEVQAAEKRQADVILLELGVSSVEINTNSEADDRRAQAEAEAAVRAKEAHLAIGMQATFKFYQSKAQAGEGYAQLRLGEIYLHGKGVETNFTLARQWLSTALTNGYPQAADLLSEIERKGVRENVSLPR